MTRGALDALTLRLDGTPAAANTITRKHAVFRNALSYAVELGLLTASPLDRIAWNPPNASSTVDPRSAASPTQVRAILTEVTRIRPDLTAFFGCLYYAALRPAEAVALRLDDCDLPARGWGQADPDGPLPSFRPCLDRQRHLPRAPRPQAPPPRSHPGRAHPTAARHPLAPPRPGLRRHARRADIPRRPRRDPARSCYGRIWHTARAAALGPALAATPLARRPYDLRHAALSLWLASGAPPAEIAARAGHSTHVLLSVYAHSIPGHDQIASRAIEHALSPDRTPSRA